MYLLRYVAGVCRVYLRKQLNKQIRPEPLLNPSNKDFFIVIFQKR